MHVTKYICPAKLLKSDFDRYVKKLPASTDFIKNLSYLFSRICLQYFSLKLRQALSKLLVTQF